MMRSTLSSSGLRRRRGALRAFSLLELAIAQMIVGMTIAAMCELFAAGGAATAGATELTQAINLANIPHDIALGSPFSDGGGEAIGPFRRISDLNGRNFSPPIDVEGVPILSAQGWRQEITVQVLDPDEPLAQVAQEGQRRAVRLTVAIYRHDRFVYAGHWLMAAPGP